MIIARSVILITEYIRQLSFVLCYVYSSNPKSGLDPSTNVMLSSVGRTKRFSPVCMAKRLSSLHLKILCEDDVAITGSPHIG